MYSQSKTRPSGQVTIAEPCCVFSIERPCETPDAVVNPALEYTVANTDPQTVDPPTTVMYSPVQIPPAGSLNSIRPLPVRVSVNVALNTSAASRFCGRAWRVVSTIIKAQPPLPAMKMIATRRTLETRGP